MTRPIHSLGFAAALFFAGNQAGAMTIGFEDLAVGTTLSTQYAALGATFSANAYSGPGTSSSGEDWATNTDMTIVSSTGNDAGDLGGPSLVSGNLLGSFNGWLLEDGDPSFRISFSAAVTYFSATFAGVFTPADVRVYAYNGSTLLGSVVGTAVGQSTLGYSAAAITSVVVTPGSYEDWVGVDNVTYTPAVTAAVPEPTTCALFGVGLGLLALRRRQSPR